MSKRKITQHQLTHPTGQNNSFTKKQKGYIPSVERGEIAPAVRKAVKGKLTQNMPLDKFLEILNLPGLRASFKTEKRSGKVRRNVIYSMLSLMELISGKKQKKCSSELACLLKLLQSNLVTKANHRAVYIQLSKLIDNVLFDPDRGLNS